MAPASSQNAAQGSGRDQGKQFQPVFDFYHEKEASMRRKRSRDETNEPNPERPSEKRLKQEQREETNVWTTVKKFLQDPKSTPEPAVSCPICYGEIAINGLPRQSPCPYKLSEGWQKVGITLPCAHIICQDCTEKHLDAQDEMGREPTCPVCRFNLRHNCCEHTVASKRLPIASYETIDIIPLTLPELPAGERNLLPDNCLPCLRQGVLTYLDTGLEYIINEIHGTEQQSYANDSQWQNVVGRMQGIVSNFVNQRKTGPHWDFFAMSDYSLQVAFVDDETVANLAPEIRYAGGDVILDPRPEDAQGAMGQSYWFVPVARSSRPF